MRVLTTGRSRFVLIATIAAGALLAAGCGNIAENVGERVAEEAAEQAGGGDVNIDVGESGAKIETSEGAFSVGGGEVPAGIPGDLLPDADYEVVQSMEQSDDQAGSSNLEAQVALNVKATHEDILAFYDETLAAAGYEITMRQVHDGELGIQGASLAGESDDGSSVVVQIANRDEDQQGVTFVNLGVGQAGQ